MLLSNRITIEAVGNKVTYSKLINSRLIRVTKTVESVQKALFWAKMYSTLNDAEWLDLAVIDE